jgi:hypothetical protein
MMQCEKLFMLMYVPEVIVYRYTILSYEHEGFIFRLTRINKTAILQLHTNILR